MGSIWSVVQMKLSEVINASGKMSILGVSVMSDPVILAMKEGAAHFYIMEELHEQAGAQIAAYLQTESVMVTNSASSGIALSVAGLITKDNQVSYRNVYDKEIFPKREVVLMKGHQVDYGAPIGLMVETGGGIVKEAGYANGCTIEQIKSTVTSQTACLLYVQSHHAVQKGMPSLESISALANELNIPLVVDAAAESQWQRYTNLADIVIISGAKALNGPTSGIIAGKKDLITAVRAHQFGIGRAMKVGKEAVLGLVRAVEEYPDNSMTKKVQLQLLDTLNRLEKIQGIKVSEQPDSAGREIYRGRIHIDANITNVSASTVVKKLRTGNPAIYTRDYEADQGYFDIDPRSVSEAEMHVIAEKIEESLRGSSKNEA